MQRHIDECVSYKVKKTKQTPEDDQESTTSIKSLFGRHSGIDNLTDNHVKDALLNYFISGNIAFNQADNPEFQTLISMIRVNGRSVVINRRSLRDRLSQHAAKAKEDLKAQLTNNDSKVSLALDCWTSHMNHAHLGKYSVTHKSSSVAICVHICALQGQFANE